MQTTLVAGETFNYLATSTEYPSPEWSLRLILNPRLGGTIHTVNSAAQEPDHLLQVTAAITSDWTPGWYAWEIWALKAGEQYRIESGQLEVKPGLIGAAAGTDIRSQAQKALDDAKAALAAWTPTTRRYEIAGRMMEFNSASEIIKLISHWENEVRRERDALAMQAGRPSSRKVFVRMARA